MNPPSLSHQTFRLVGYCLALLLTGALRLWSQAGSLDATFQLATVGWVTSMAFERDGKILAAGHAVHPEIRCGLIRLNLDGSNDEDFVPALLPFDEDFGRGGILRSVAVQKNGRILVGGAFRTVGMEYVDGAITLARLNPDGSVDPHFTARLAFQVDAIALQHDQRILIGGFASLARLEHDGSPDSRFDIGSGPDGPVHAIAVLPRRQILVGGGFGTFNGVARSGLVRLHPDGSLDPTFHVTLEGPPSSPGASAQVLCFVVEANDTVLVGGRFGRVNGIEHNSVVRLRWDGSVDTGLHPLIGADIAIHAMATQRDGKVLVAGAQFAPPQGTQSGFMARLNPDGSIDSSFQLGEAIPWSEFNALLLQENGQALVGAVFYDPATDSYGGVVRLLGD